MPNNEYEQQMPYEQMIQSKMQAKMQAKMRAPLLALGLALGAFLGPWSHLQAKTVEIHFKPSMTDVSIHEADTPHMALYEPLKGISKLMVYLTGDSDHQEVSTEFYKTLVGLGYHVIALTYMTQPKVNEVCRLAAIPAEKQFSVPARVLRERSKIFFVDF